MWSEADFLSVWRRASTTTAFGRTRQEPLLLLRVLEDTIQRGPQWIPFAMHVRVIRLLQSCLQQSEEAAPSSSGGGGGAKEQMAVRHRLGAMLLLISLLEQQRPTQPRTDGTVIH